MPFRAVILGFSLIFHAGSLPAQQPPPRIPAAEWRDDLDSLRAILLRVHPRPFFRSDSIAFVRRWKRIRDSVPALTDAGIAVRLMHLVAGLGDGHTVLEGSDRLGFDRWFPLRFYRFSDGIYVTAAAGPGRAVLGARVVSLDGHPVDQVADSVARVQQTDNPLFIAEATFLLSSPPVLHALGFTRSLDTLSLVVEDHGVRRTAHIGSVTSHYDLTWRFWGEMFGPPMPDSLPMETAWRGLAPQAFRTIDRSRPPHLQYRRHYHYTILADRDAAYMQFNFVNDLPGGPDFETFIDSMFADIDRRRLGSFVLDLRRNSGGDGSMLLPLVHALIKRDDSINRPGRLFVLVGRQTYSAALMLMGLLRQHTDAVFVGEPPGAPLNSYGDPVEHRLAHTGMAFSVSQRYWQFSLSDDTARTVPIEVPAQFSFADWVAGRDPALDAILPLGRYRRVLDVLKANGAEAGRPLYAEQKARAAGVSWWQPWDRDDMRHVGQDLLAEGRIQDAVAAFELNQERFPEWWRSWDGLGDAYAAAGHSARAIQAYRRALAIAPNNWNSRHEQSQIDALSRR